jgi:hypothetical protein
VYVPPATLNVGAAACDAAGVVVVTTLPVMALPQAESPLATMLNNAIRQTCMRSTSPSSKACVRRHSNAGSDSRRKGGLL